MKKKYDHAIDEHYKKVANETGLLSTSTMGDEITRSLETKAIMDFVGECLRLRQEISVSSLPTIVDIGCGNGFTLEQIQIKYPQYNLKKHKGYPTKEHIELLKEHGVIDIYRKSFRPVKELI